MNSSNKSSLLFGTIIIIFGLVLLLNNFNIADIDLGDIISTYWPIVFIYFGIDTLTTHHHKRKNINKGNLITGLFLILLGGAILGRNMGYYNFDFSILWNSLWPIIIIIIGFNILKGSQKTKSSSWALMSGVEHKNEGWKLTDKSYFAFMGGVDLDLAYAEIVEENTVLDLTVFMGGMDIKAPKDLNIICKSKSFLGGVGFFNDGGGGILLNREFEHKGNSSKTVTIYCRAIMGGIDIKESKR